MKRAIAPLRVPLRPQCCARLGEIEHVLARFLQQPLRKDALRVRAVLLAGAAQILCMDVAPHAAVDLAVAATRRVPSGARYTGLVNAVLRRVAAEGAAVLAQLDGVVLNTPAWMWQRWCATYGAETARRIAQASLREAALDITVKPGEDAAAWAGMLHGTVLATGTVRLQVHQGRIEELPGYGDGAWWVQDAAAALVARVAGDVAGDAPWPICARRPAARPRCSRPRARMSPRWTSRRGGWSAWPRTWPACGFKPRWSQPMPRPGPRRVRYDAVVLDAPCTATGTIRRHPDILRLKAAADVARMAQVQRALLDNAARSRAPRRHARLCHLLARARGGRAAGRCLPRTRAGLFAQPHRGIRGRRRCRLGHRRLRSAHVSVPHAGAARARAAPNHCPISLPEALAGMDGFYIARLRRHA